MQHIKEVIKPLLIQLKEKVLKMEYTNQRSLMVDQIDNILEKTTSNDRDIKRSK